MTFAPQSLRDLAAYWKGHGGINLGIVGDTDHTNTGTSYHLGKDQLKPDAYSAKLPRDVAGLTNAASAIDLGKLGGTLQGLQGFSRWLVAQCMAGKEGSRDVREIIYSPDGVLVQRWSGVDNAIHKGPGNGDSSHRTHTHISYYRDSEKRSKLALFRPYFTEAAPVLNYTHIDGQPDSGPGTVTITIDGAAVILADGTLFFLPQGSVKHSYGLIRFKDGQWKGQDAYLVGQDCGFLLKRAASYVADSGDTEVSLSVGGAEVWKGTA